MHPGKDTHIIYNDCSDNLVFREAAQEWVCNPLTPELTAQWVELFDVQYVLSSYRFGPAATQ